MAAWSPGPVDGVKVVKYENLRFQRFLGRGAFAEAHLAHCDNPNVNNPVVVKRLNQPVDAYAKNLFVKEAKLLSGLRHENIVRFYGICDGPFAIILEYLVFTFNPFWCQNTPAPVNTVDKFLQNISQLPIQDTRFDHVIPVIADDAAKGLCYLHNQGIAHRDIKPCNILISNQHYCYLNDSVERDRQKSARPVICKLADFGESRSQMIQTERANDPATNRGWRGTISFMAPEIFFPEGANDGNKRSLQDLKMIDIWAIGLVFYCLVNPGVIYPYARDAIGVDDLFNIHRERRHPSADPSYEPRRATVWSNVQKAYQACTKHDPSKRSTASQVLGILQDERQPERSALVGHASTPRTTAQWYNGPEGETTLKYVFSELKTIADNNVVDMIRNKDTRNITMNFEHRGKECRIDFPFNFPTDKASLNLNGVESDKIGGDTVEIAVRSMISIFSSTDQPASVVQWYACEEGESHLKSVFDELKNIADGKVAMSRQRETQDVTMTIERHGQSWKVKFPANFPSSRATVIKNGAEQVSVGDNTVEGSARAIVDHIVAQWYNTSEGEAALKYVFDELTQISDNRIEMSRNRNSQNITLKLLCHGHQWQVKFPPDFPTSNATVVHRDNNCESVGGENLEVAVKAIRHHISSSSRNQRAGTISRRTMKCFFQ
ncbi:Mitogen-activated protein kinase kinase kinase 2 [Acropora cervicornis]|uniref:Mitogen-activated protein kinase kinase kinase 2 n=1 Tax=Acropora cervicornis TaxID=6130 RepID=A0AAD9UU34_ACRCE|nr:Mitogen-activated protein kinase kinase kinase 2 [Acropora cervicornis]